ncbi:MAG: hypothetical protein NTW95_07515 [Candidatus Aminicenantes bacterium]|nr:hypothetical protein [Candidatus Aminicenantes bacterium]
MSARRVLVAFYFFLFAASAVAVQPYNNPLTLAQLQALAALTAGQQQQDANQRQLQHWFFYNVEYFRHAPEVSVIGRSPLISLGPPAWPPDAIYDAVVRPRGMAYILFDPATPNPATLDNVTFPAPPHTLRGTTDDTCWEEAQHLVLGRHDLRPIVDLVTWSSYREGHSDQERREHIFINFARVTTTWIQQLQGFETEARKAYAEEMKLVKNGVRINLETEHVVWREAWNRWKNIWDKSVEAMRTGKRLIIPLTRQMASQYEQLSGVRIPTENQVITFYMNGGLTDDANPERNKGQRINISEWVMRPHPFRSKLLKIQHTPADPVAVLLPGANERLECKFTIQLIDTYTPYGKSYGGNNPVVRGKLSVVIQRPGPDDLEPEISLEVKQGTRVFAAARGSERYNMISIDLADAYRQELQKNTGSDPMALLRAITRPVQPLSFAINFSRRKPTELKGRRQYVLIVRYVDTDGPKDPAVYENMTAPFVINLDSTAGTTVGAGGTAPPAGGPAWVLTKTTVETKKKAESKSRQFNEGYGLVNVKDTLDIKGTDRNASCISKSIMDLPKGTPTGPLHRESELRYDLSWTAPPPRLPFGWTMPVELTWKRSYRATVPEKLTDSIGGLFYNMFNGKFGVKPFGIVVSDAAPGPLTDSFLVPPPDDPNHPILTVRVTWEGYQEVYHEVVFEYGLQKGPAPSISGQVTPPKAELPVEDTDIDNVPPEVEEDEPPIPPVREGKQVVRRWYTHPSGNYRLPLPDGWNVAAKHLFDEVNVDYDTLMPLDQGMALICARGLSDHKGEQAGRILSEYAQRLLKQNPGSRSADFRVGFAPAVQVVCHDPKDKVMHWYFKLFERGSSYNLFVVMPAAKTMERMPTMVEDLLAKAQMKGEW